MNGTKRITRSSVEQQDENARPTRVTRAKPLTAPAKPEVKVLKKRAALGDVSNQPGATVISTAVNGKKSTLPVLPVKQPLKTKTTVLKPAEKRKTVTRANSKIGQVVVVEEPSIKKVKTSPASPHSPEIRNLDAQSKEDAFAQAIADAQIEQTWDDLDAEDVDDPLMVSEYVTEIFQYLKSQETLTMPQAHYMERQKELQWKMRGILVDWLVEVHTKFRLLPETLFLTVNIIDRFLSLRVCTLNKLQLVGITALFIASKYEEVMCPSIQNFVYMADGGYTDDEILKAEQYVLQVLNFNLSFPNPMNFLRRVSKADNYDVQVRTVGKYLMEISLVDHRFLVFPPSLIAGAAIWLARAMLQRGPWDDNLIHFSGYTEKALMPCAKLMFDYLGKTVRHDAFFKKYASKKFIKASLYCREWVKKRDRLPIALCKPDPSEDEKWDVESDVDY